VKFDDVRFEAVFIGCKHCYECNSRINRLQLMSPSHDWGSGGRRFESGHPDHFLQHLSLKQDTRRSIVTRSLTENTALISVLLFLPSIFTMRSAHRWFPSLLPPLPPPRPFARVTRISEWVYASTWRRRSEPFRGLLASAGVYLHCATSILVSQCRRCWRAPFWRARDERHDEFSNRLRNQENEPARVKKRDGRLPLGRRTESVGTNCAPSGDVGEGGKERREAWSKRDRERIAEYEREWLTRPTITEIREQHRDERSKTIRAGKVVKRRKRNIS
jgi:hypothetical protein